MKEIVIQGENIHDIPSFYQEINRLFMQNEDWKIGNSLDALDDLLYGGFGSMREEESFKIIILNSDFVKNHLGFETTLAYYQQKIYPESPFNQSHFINKIEELKNGNGQTYFDVIIEIIKSHNQIHLELK